MDLWVVAGAAAAGYLAKYWQNISRDRDGLPDLSLGISKLENPESSSYPFRRLAQRKKIGDNVFMDRKRILDQISTNTYQLDGASEAEVASFSGFDGKQLGNLGNNDDYNILVIPNSSSGTSTNENIIENESENGLTLDFGNDSCNHSVGEIESFHGSAKNIGSLRTKRSYGHLIKPQSSLESCLMAQLYKEHVKMEEYVLSALPSPSTPTMRPLLVTDGSRIISKAHWDSFNALNETEDNRFNRGACFVKNEIVFGVPPLPKRVPLDISKKIKPTTAKGLNGRLSSSSKVSSGKHCNSQGSDERKVLFCLGISVGIVSSLMANRREVDKLKDLLKQTENLVQDLQEELEMKDSVTVKELVNENYGSQETCDSCFQERALNPFSPEGNVDNSTEYHGKQSLGKKEAGSFESMSKIEAELEAELERLGLNMNTSGLEKRLSDRVELDPDFDTDFALGELRDDMNDRATSQTESNKDASSSSTSHSGNYTVSPRELSLRLHEVIQSRLERRVLELETALENSQRKIQLIESDHQNRYKKFSSGEGREIFAQIDKEKCDDVMAQPLVMNLAGEALDAYNEAYEELMRVSESEDEDSPSKVYYTADHQMGFHSFDQRVSLVRNGMMLNGSSPHVMLDNVETPDDQISRIQDLLDVVESGEETSDCDDEMEKQLIKQIVEKTKKGSSVVLNAQRVFFSIDETEN